MDFLRSDRDTPSPNEKMKLFGAHIAVLVPNMRKLK